MRVVRKSSSSAVPLGSVPRGRVLSVDAQGGLFMRIDDGNCGGSQCRIVVLGPDTRADLGQVVHWSSDTLVFVHADAEITVTNWPEAKP